MIQIKTQEKEFGLIVLFGVIGLFFSILTIYYFIILGFNNLVLIPALGSIMPFSLVHYLNKQDTYNDTESVSEIILTDKTLSFVYKYRSHKREEVINLEDIISTKVILNTKYTTSRSGYSLYGWIDLIIKTKDKTITIDINLPHYFFKCRYLIMFKLMSLFNNLPNFSYKVIANTDLIKADIEKYAKFGKRFSFWETRKILFLEQFEKSSILGKIFLIIGYIFIFFIFLPFVLTIIGFAILGIINIII